MSIPIYIVDAFTDRPFAGNPAAVCLLKEKRDDTWMQRVAAEMNLSETAFLNPRPAGGWHLRWFTPRVEVDLCGHATLASAHTLWQTGAATEPGTANDGVRLSFHTRSGVLHAERDGTTIRLDFPADPPTLQEPASTTVRALGTALGSTPVAVWRGREDLLAVLPDAESVRRLGPDIHALSTLDARGIIVTAAGDEPGVDFISRFFGPAVGIDEDPVTGSAHCVLAPYWSQKLGRYSLHGYQASARGGHIGVRWQGDRVHLTGQAVTTVEGRLHD